MKKTLIITIIALLLSGCFESPEPAIQETNTEDPAPVNQDNTQSETQTSTPVASYIKLDVPFTSQAPHSNWDDPYQEACEEASLIMAYDFYQGKTSYTKEEADQRILELVSYQNNNGYGEDVTLKELQEITLDFYSMQSKILEQENINLESFKQELNEGNPIIIPAAGQKLGNPNFSGDGPPFHMLVVIGYDESSQTFITHDPGTRNGKDYEYSYQTILTSIRDWTGSKDTIEQGTPRAMVLTPQ